MKGFVKPTFEYFRLNTIRKTPIISNILHTGLHYQELENWNNINHEGFYTTIHGENLGHI